MNSGAAGALVSVVVPTYHRPAALRSVVESVLAQDADGSMLEVIIAVSDPAAGADVAAAAALARDPRVRVASAPRAGPAAARNAGIDAARGARLAFIDDDCVAQPGWLRAGLDALAGADLVQGRTSAAGPTREHDRYVANDHMSWLWEACNLFVRRSAIERAGMFDESFNPTGAIGRHFGEDVEWGWRLVRRGATYAYARDAVVHHAVEPRGYWEFLHRHLELRWFPLLVRHAPELRRKFHHGYFFNRRHAVLALGLAIGGGAGIARAAGARRTARAAALTAIGTQVAWWRRAASLGELGQMIAKTPERTLTEAIEVGALVYGSARYRCLLV